MTPLAVQTLPLTVVTVLVAATLVLTWFAHSRQQRARATTTLAGPAWPRRTGNGLALAGDQISAASFLGITGAIALAGFNGFWLAVGMPIAYVLVLLLVSRRAAAQPRQVHARRRHRDALREPGPAQPDRGGHDHHDRHLHDNTGARAHGLIKGALLGVDFTVAVLILGVLMTIYTVLGGMVAATYIQIFKTSLLAVMVLAVFVVVIGARVDWVGPMLDAADQFGAKVVEPDRSNMTESNLKKTYGLSLTIGLTLGIVGTCPT